MGASIFKRNCPTGLTPAAFAPNPSPERWELLELREFTGGHVLRVKYLDCTNFEGVKIMVYEGGYIPTKILDPHFRLSAGGPIARFRPDEDGWKRALLLAQSLPPVEE